MGIKTNALLRFSLLAVLVVGMEAGATTLQIDIDTSALGINGQNWDLAFDLIGGNPQPNSASMSSFAITGGALTATPTFYPNSGNVTGNLSVPPGIVTLSDSIPADSLFNEYTHNANIGSMITFVLDITGNRDPGFEPDTYSFFFLNHDTGLPLDTADPTGALFVFSIGNANQPATFCPTTAPCVRISPVVVAAPEPGALALALCALLAMGFVRANRRSPFA